MNFNKVDAETVAQHIVDQFEIQRGWEDPITATVQAKHLELTHHDVLYGKLHSNYHEERAILNQVQTLGIYNDGHAYKIAKLVQDLLNEKIIDANANFFSEETLHFIREHDDETVGNWVADQLKYGTEDAGAHWCAGCATNRQYACRIEHLFLCINLCTEQHRTGDRYIQDQLKYALPRDMHHRIPEIASHAYEVVVG